MDMGTIMLRVNAWKRPGAILFLLVLGSGACTPPGGNGSGGGGGGGGGGSVIDVPDFVDSSDPEFAGSEEVPQEFFVNVVGQTGKVELPTGVNLALTDLQLVSAEGAAEIAADGTVTPTLPGLERYLTQVVDSSDRIILFGYAQSAGSTPLPINAKSTAVALLYFALGAWTLPGDLARGDVIRELNFSYNEIVDELTATIEDAMRDNSRAINDGDERVISAVVAARDEILASADGPIAKVVKDHAKIGPNLQNGDAAALGFITTDPERTVAQSGIFLRTSLSSDGITPLNRYRRRAKLFAYLTATESAGGEIMALDPIEYAAGPVDILPAGNNSSDKGLLEQAIDGDASWDPTFSETIRLVDEEVVLPGDDPIVPDESDTAIRHFDIVVLGPALDQASTSSVVDDPRFAAQRAEFLAVIDDLEWRTFLLDYFVPLIDECGVGTVIITPDVTTDARVAALRALVEPVITGAGLSLKTAQDYSMALVLCLEEFKNNTTFRNSYLAIMKRSLGQANSTLSYNAVGERTVRTLLSIVGGVVIVGVPDVGDVGAVYAHLQNSHEADLWEATISRVTVYPRQPEVTKQATRVRLSAKVGANEGRMFCYEWNSPSAFGYLSEIQGTQVDPTIFTDEDAINYTATPTAINNNDLDEVTVTVYDVTDADGATSNCAQNAGLGVKVGSAAVTVYGRDLTDPCPDFDLSLYNRGPLTMSVSPGRVLPGDEVTVTLSYDFGQTTAASAQVFLYLPRACSSCLTDACMCGPAEQAGLLYDGGATPLYNVQQQGTVSGIGRIDAQGVPGLITDCVWELSPIFSLPDPEVREVITSEFTYVFHQANYPRQEGLGPVCPALYPDPFAPAEMGWRGLFVIAREFAGGANGMATQLLDLGTDPGFDFEVTDPCDE